MSASPNFDDPSLWDIRRGVVVFREHYRPEKQVKDGKGAVVKTVPARDFKLEDLQTIVKNCNDRDRIGLPAAVTIGHTTDENDEGKQPDIVGYDRNFRVEWSERLGKYVIEADRYFHRERAEEAEQYPRTSVEHWINQDFFDPIAIVKRTPKLDIPQWHYLRRRHGDVVRYTMEDDAMPDPTQAPDAKTPSGDLKELVMQCLKECMADPAFRQQYSQPSDKVDPEKAKKILEDDSAQGHPLTEKQKGMFGAAAGRAEKNAMSQTNDAERFASEAERIRYTRQQEQIDSQGKELAALKERHRREKAEATVKQLLYEGYDFGGTTAEDRTKRTERAVQKFMRLDDAEAREYEAEIRECYQKAPVGGSPLSVYDPTAELDRQRRPRQDTVLPESEADCEALTKHMRKTGESDPVKAWKEVKASRAG